MPNHIHVLVHLWQGHPIGKVVQAWKSYTAHKANQILQREGKFWQSGYFDRFIRDEEHFANAIDYIHDNPRAAGLVKLATDWQFSSIHEWQQV